MIEKINDFLYPPRCPVCDGILYMEDVPKRPKVCPECLMAISMISPPYCMKCSKPLDDDFKELCQDCERKEHAFVRGVAAFSYSKAMKRSMYGFKYNNRREYGKYYADVIWEKFGSTIMSWNADALIPVPLHSARFRKRGYNQAQVLAKELGKLSGIKLDDEMLVRVKNTKPQKELTDKERNNNIESAFQIRINDLKYSKVILVDDIYTTGATINECAKVLLDGGVGKVYFITACIGNGF